MKFKYQKAITETAEIELKVPYYYEEISDTEYKMVGKLTEKEDIEIFFGYYTKSTEVRIEKSPNPEEDLSYILEYCIESTKDKFEAAKKEALDFLK